MQHNEQEDREYPEPETVLAIRGAISTGQLGGPMGPPGHWLNEFWQIGAALRDHAEMVQGFQISASREQAKFGRVTMGSHLGRTRRTSARLRDMKLFEDEIASNYGLTIGEALFPGEHHFSRLHRLTVESLVAEMLAAGVEPTLVNVGNHLATFVPTRMRDAASDQDLRDWEHEKHEIFNALQKFFIDGGHQQRIAEQMITLDALQRSGVKIEGRDVLESRLLWSGDWRKHLLYLALRGRPHGIRFRLAVMDSAAIDGVRNVLEAGGLSPDQQDAWIAALGR